MTLCLHVLLFTVFIVRLIFSLHPGADDMQEDERQLWTEQILHWMCSPDTSTEIRFACGQALTGAHAGIVLMCLAHTQHVLLLSMSL